VRTPTERAAIEARRNRVPVLVAALAAVVLLATSFPLAVLYGQHHQLSAEASQLSQLRHQNALLAEQRQALNSNAEVKRLARQNYQLVAPGQALYDILPAAGQTSAPGAPSAGDPANQPLVSPSQAPNMSPDPGLPATSTASGTTGASSAPSSTSTAQAPAAAHGGFWTRVRSTLEFWR
jgi:cell division protein FtsB